MKTVGNCMISPVLSIEQDENVKDTAENRGMINRISYLVAVQEA